ncbi:MAG: DASS family sodium-coupled anion symporter [Firmicutes bacterium]|nr:DASS family sodium-coupled anion symporter [Bacillota bacterium]
MNRFVKLAICFGAGIAVYLLGMAIIDFSPSVQTVDKIPQLTAQAWLFLSIFLGVIIGLILEPIPPALMGLVGIAIAVFFRVGAAYPATMNPGDAISFTTISNSAAVTWGLSGFADSTVWLIFAAFAIGLGYLKSGLGHRIAMLLVSKLGKSTLGLGYAIALTDGVLAPFIPSNTARSGGVVYPIVSSIPGMFDSSAEKDRRKIGSYVMWVALASTCVTSSMFMTGLAPNALALSTTNSPITWLGWLIAFLPAGIILFLLTPFLSYKLYPPEIKGSPEIVSWAKTEARKLGPISDREKWMLAISLFALLFWILSSIKSIASIWPLALNATTTALLAIVFMMATKVITWEDFLGNKPAWNVLMWFGTLVALASGLRNVGFLDWLGNLLKLHLNGVSPMFAIFALVLSFWFLHYFFASTTAHVTALMALYLVIIQAVFIDDPAKIFLVTVLLMLELGIMGIISPYGTGPSPVYFGSGYIKSGEFWKLGTIFGFVNLIVFLAVEIPWVLFVVNNVISP